MGRPSARPVGWLEERLAELRVVRLSDQPDERRRWRCRCLDCGTEVLVHVSSPLPAYGEAWLPTLLISGAKSACPTDSRGGSECGAPSRNASAGALSGDISPVALCLSNMRNHSDASVGQHAAARSGV